MSGDGADEDGKRGADDDPLAGWPDSVLAGVRIGVVADRPEDTASLRGALASAGEVVDLGGVHDHAGAVPAGDGAVVDAVVIWSADLEWGPYRVAGIAAPAVAILPIATVDAVADYLEAGALGLLVDGDALQRLPGAVAAVLYGAGIFDPGVTTIVVELARDGSSEE